MTKEMETRTKLSVLMAVEAMRKAAGVLEALLELMELTELAEAAAAKAAGEIVWDCGPAGPNKKEDMLYV